MIKISSLKSVLHDTSELEKRSKEYIESIEKEMGDKIIFSELKDYDCDLKLIFIESGGSEQLFKNKMNSLKEPFYFLTSGEDNSLAATIEILTYLNSIGKKGEILHGPISYIASRIKILTRKENEKIKLIQGMRFGIIGVPSDWLIASIPERTKLEDKFQIQLIDIDIDELIHQYKKVIHKDLNDFEQAHVLLDVLRDIVSKYQLDGLTIRCFDLLNTIHTTSCLGLSMLNQDGIIGTCEGDIMSMITMAIVRKLANQSSFQANPSKIDVINNTILFAHCTVPFDMIQSNEYRTHFESNIGIALQGEMRKETVTVFRLSSDLKHYFVSKGEIIETPKYENLCRTQIVIKLEKDVKELLTNPCGNHHIIFYGDYVKEINELLN